MPRSTALAALAVLITGGAACCWGSASAAPRQPLPPLPGPELQGQRTSPAVPALEGTSLSINGRSQQARWRWLGPDGQPPQQLWLPLEVLQNQLGVSNRSLPDGSLDLEWFGQGLKVPPAGQRALADEVALDALPLLRAVGVGLDRDGARLRLSLPNASLLQVRSSSQGAGRRVVLDLDAPALVIRKVQVHHVHFVGSNQVNVALDVVYTEKVTGYVKHGAAKGISRHIPNCTAGHQPGPRLLAGRFNIGRQQLANGLNAPKQSRRSIGLQVH